MLIQPRTRTHRLAALLLTLGMALALLVVQPTARAEAGPDDLVPVSGGSVIIDNGTIQLGVNDEGHLNVPGGVPSSGTGTRAVGLRYLPTGAEATAPGCLCEGWGVADAIRGVTGYANVSVDGVVNIQTLDFRASASEARSTVEVGNSIRVTHHYAPSATPNLYEVTVSIQNITDEAIDARYRRVMDWDIEPTAFSEFVTAVTAGSPLLLGNTNDGFETANPLGSRNDLGYRGDFTDAGPDDHGALFDFGFGRLESGQIKTFRTYYGAAGSESAALAALRSVQAPVYSLGQPNVPGGPDRGEPNTFIFGFGDLGLTSGPITTRESFGSGNPSWSHNPQCHAGRPVNCATGNFWHSFVDVHVPTRGIALAVNRTYNAQSADRGSVFGRGWSSNLGMHLEVDDTGRVTVVQENGSVAEFVPDGAGYATRPRVQATLAPLLDGHRFVRHDSETFDFDADGRLVGHRDAFGNGVSLSHGPDGLTAVTDDTGRQIAITTDAAGRITGTTDPIGRTTSYRYDATGLLTSAVDVAGGVSRFAYDADGRMTTWTEPGGGTTTNVYDDAGRVVQQTDPTGAVLGFAYTDTTTTLTHPDGTVDVHEYLDGVLTQIIKATGTPDEATWAYTYDPDTLGRDTVTDPYGRVTTTTFDDDGAVLSIVDPMGVSESYAYDGPNGALTSMVDPTGREVRFAYDDDGRLLTTTEVDADGGDDAVQTLVYGDPARPTDATAFIDATGRTWSATYDEHGNVATATDPDGVSAQFEVDGAGRVTAVVEPAPAGGTVRTEFTLDDRNGLVRVDGPDGTVLREYDADGVLVGFTDAAGATTTITTDELGRQLATTAPDGSVRSVELDVLGRPTAVIAPDGATTTHGYDPLGRQTSTVDPLGRRWSWAYDLTGLETDAFDPNGGHTTNEFDDGGNHLAIRYGDTGTPDVEFEYDAAGRTLAMHDGTGTTTYAYDGLGRATEVAAPNGTTSYAYDLAGRVTAMTYPGDRTVTNTHDASGRLASTTDWLGNTTSYAYDQTGNLSAITYPNGVTTSASYDEAGRLVGQSHATATGTTAFTYDRDVRGSLASTQATGAIVGTTTYTYDALANVVSVDGDTIERDLGQRITRMLDGTRMAYDPGAQLTETLRGDTTTSFDFDDNGNRLSQTGTDGSDGTFTYDRANRLSTASVIVPEGGDASLAAGRDHTVALDSAGAVHTWGGDEAGQLGRDTTTFDDTPGLVPGVTATAIAAGAAHTLALTADGTVLAWGADDAGQSAGGGDAPAAVAGLDGVTAIAAGSQHSLALDGDGRVWTWGDGSATATPVDGLPTITAIAAGGWPDAPGHSLALATDGTVWAWGADDARQSAGATGTPAMVAGLSDVVAIAAGGRSSHALLGDGTVWGWGDDRRGQLASVATTGTTSTPVQADIAAIVDIDAGGEQVLAEAADGSLWAWGSANAGQLGVGGDRKATPKHDVAPTRVATDANVLTFSAGFLHSVLIDNDGQLAAWGLDTSGQLGLSAGNGAPTSASAQGDASRTWQDRDVRRAPTAGATIAATAATDAGGVPVEASYTYDGTGMRTSKTVDGDTTDFVWDVARPVPQLLLAGDTAIVHGPGGLPIAEIDADGTTRYLHHDQLGSVRLVTDAAGAVAGTATYTAYGEVETQGGVTPVLGFAGEYRDAETGFVYLRARYYDPATAQFITRDPIEVRTGDPYGYASGDPLSVVDPMGLCGWRDPWNCIDDVAKAGASAVGSAASAVGRTVVRHRHTIIDFATGVGAVVAYGAAAGACAASVVCGIAAVAGVAAGAALAHWGTDRLANDDRNLSGGEIAFRSVTNAAFGGVCGAIFAQGCAIAAGGLRHGFTWTGSRLLAPVVGILTRKAAAAQIGRLIPGIMFGAATVFKAAVGVLFDRRGGGAGASAGAGGGALSPC